VVNQGPYFALGKFLTAGQLGVFSLGYQIVTQIDQILAATLAVVLFSALAKLNEERDRQRAAALRAARLVTLVASVASFGLMSTVGPLARLIWGQKWVDSILPAQILASVFAWRVLLWVPAPALQAQGRFRFSAMLVLTAGVALTGAAVAGAVWGGGDAVMIAAAMAPVMAFGFLGLSLWGLAEVGVRPIEVLRQTVPSWLCGGLAGIGALAAYSVVHPRLVAAIVQPLLGFTDPGDVLKLLNSWIATAVVDPMGAVAGGVSVGPLVEGLPRLLWENRLVAGADLVITGSVFLGLVYVLFRLLLPAALRELAAMAPARLGFIRKFV
jgi:PST family polysaccharide transporter